MILDLDSLQTIRGNVSMVDGSFDPLHDGHIRYFAFAASLGLPVFCNIASDDWTSAKHAILLEQEKRAVVIDAVRFIDYVYCADTSTADVLRLVRPRKYVKGADWRDRGGVPEVETAICDEFGIEIVYANTEMNSSSRILKRFSGHHE